MAAEEQAGPGGSDEFAAMKAGLDKTLAYAEWMNQAPPSPGSGTAERSSGPFSWVAAELARIAICYDLKEASDRFRDAAVLAGGGTEISLAYYDEAQARIKDAQKRLGCPPS